MRTLYIFPIKSGVECKLKYPGGDSQVIDTNYTHNMGLQAPLCGLNSTTVHSQNNTPHSFADSCQQVNVVVRNSQVSLFSC